MQERFLEYRYDIDRSNGRGRIFKPLIQEPVFDPFPPARENEPTLTKALSSSFNPFLAPHLPSLEEVMTTIDQICEGEGLKLKKAVFARCLQAYGKKPRYYTIGVDVQEIAVMLDMSKLEVERALWTIRNNDMAEYAWGKVVEALEKLYPID